MDLEAKKGILLAIISATEKSSIIDHLITIAWEKEVEPERSIALKEGKKPPRPKEVRKNAITIHGQPYKSLRYACLEVWGLERSEYDKIKYQIQAGSDIHDLLQPRREEDKRLLPTNKSGVVLTSQEGAEHG